MQTAWRVSEKSVPLWISHMLDASHKPAKRALLMIRMLVARELGGAAVI
jgi:hypothetical protein